MKKLLIGFMTLLLAAALGACSNRENQQSSGSSSSSADSVSTSSSSSSSSSHSSESASSSQDGTSSEPLVADEELQAAITVGDYKALFSRLQERVTAQLQAIGERYPAAAEVYQKSISSLSQLLEEQRQNFDQLLSSFGDDEASIPEQARITFIRFLQSVRDLAQRALETAEEQFQQVQ